MSDARFEDGRPGHDSAPLRLRAFDAEDLRVLATLTQDAVFLPREMRWQPRLRRFALLLNRFRWEAPARRHAPERVQAVLAVEDVAAVRSQGFPREGEAAQALLDLRWQPGEEGAGRLHLLLSGGGEIALDCEALEATLRDVTRPVPARRRPQHPGQGV